MPETPVREAQQPTLVTMSEATIAEGSAEVVPEPGARIGRFVVLRKVGFGGMGVVYAGYDDQLDRKVAIKLIRQPTKHAARRLAREAQALAKLSHPNVVQIYEIGAHTTGAFIAMEFVEGQTLGAWSRAQPRAWRDSLAVMVQAGRGLAAAHAKGLVHRDFKPDNVMIDDEGRVRVMDFGLVHGALAPDRASDGDAELESSVEFDASDPSSTGTGPSGDLLSPLAHSLTMAGSTLGTPAYMPPEQHLGLATDARSDQFSYCVALWELLYGQRPFTGKTLAALCMAVTQHELRDAPAQAEVPGWLRKVITRGLAADPSERWPNMDALLLALADDPRPRRAASVVAAGLVLASLAGWGLWTLKLDRDHDRAIATCEHEARAVDAVWNDAVVAELEAGFVGIGGAVTDDSWSRVHTQLDDYSERWTTLHRDGCRAATVDERVDADTHTRARACFDDALLSFSAIVDVLHEPSAELVAYAARLPHKLPRLDDCADADALARRRRPSETADTAASAQLRAELQRAYALEVVGRYAQGRTLAEHIIADASRLELPTIESEARLVLGDVIDALGDYPGSRSEYEQAFRIAGTERADALALRAASKLIVEVGSRLGQQDAGHVWAELGTMLAARLGERSLDAAVLHSSIASLERADNNLDEALVHASLALEIELETLGDQHPDLAAPLLTVASIHLLRDEFDEAQVLADRALALREAAFGPRHPDVADTLATIANIHDGRGEFDEARALTLRVLNIREQAFGPDHPDVGSSLIALALIEMYRGHDVEALTLLERALTIREAALGPDDAGVAAVLDNLSIVHFRLGDLERAIECNRRALTISERVFGPEHPRVAGHLTNLVQYLVAEGRFDEAEVAAARALAIVQTSFGSEHSSVANAIAGLGSVLEARGDLRGALVEYQRSLAIFERVLGTEHYDLADPLFMIADAHQQLGEYELARVSYERSLAVELAVASGGSRTAETRLQLAQVCWALGDRAVARRYGAEALTDLEDNDAADDLVTEVRAWVAAHPEPRAD